MDEKEFWGLIQEANASVGSTKAIPEWLISRLADRDTKEIFDFQVWLAKFYAEAKDKRLWAGGCVINGSLSDDGFDYFRCWLIAQGEVVYKTAVADPDSLVNARYENQGMFGPSIELEPMLYVANDAFNRKAGRPRFTEMKLPAGYQSPPGSSPDSSNWKNEGFLELSDDKEALTAHFPKLMRRFCPKNDNT